MQVQTYAIEGLKLIKPKVFRDHRGFFLESYNQRTFADHGINDQFVQDNHSRSVKGTLRGLHYQVNHEQAKLVRCIRGEVFDVAVDIRPNSPTFGQWEGVILNEENHHQFLVPAGFAHGFQVLSETAEITYKCTDFYSPPDDRGVMWNDPRIGIVWPGGNEPILSEKDTKHPLLADVDVSEIKGA